MNAYEGYREWKNWDSRGFGVCTLEESSYFAKELSLADFGKLRGLKVLEVGFGNGAFAAWSLSRGAEWSGIEEIPQLVHEARTRGWAAYPSGALAALASAELSFDVAVAFDVFEHLDVDGLVDLLVKIRGRLVRGGRLIARVPSGDSPFARAIQHGDTTHRSIIGSSAVAQIAARCGYEVMQVREPAFPVRGAGFGVFLRRGLVCIIRATLFPVIRAIFMANSRAVISPNLVFVLRNPS